MVQRCPWRCDVEAVFRRLLGIEFWCLLVEVTRRAPSSPPSFPCPRTWARWIPV